jgi:hypothetical protein
VHKNRKRWQKRTSSKLGRDLLLNIESRKLGSKGLQKRASRGAGVRNDIGSAPWVAKISTKFFGKLVLPLMELSGVQGKRIHGEKK